MAKATVKRPRGSAAISDPSTFGDAIRESPEDLKAKEGPWNVDTIIKKSVPPDDGLDIPAALKRDKATNVSPATAKPVTAKSTTAEVIRPRWDKPKGMTDAEYDEAKAKFEPTKAELSKAAKKEKKVRVPRVEAPAGTFKLSAWASEVKLDPRHVRRVARSIKDELGKLYVSGMKYVFKDADKSRVADMIHEGLAAESKKTIKAKTKKAASAPAPKIPPPSETVWSGKAKKKAPAPAPIEKSKKADDRKVLKKAVKEFGKRLASQVDKRRQAVKAK
jgi:hypothetical protein